MPIATTLVAAALFVASPALAAPGPKAKGPKLSGTSKPSTPKGQSAKGASMKPAKTTTVEPGAKGKKATTTSASTGTTTTSTSGTSDTTGTPGTTTTHDTWVPKNPVAEKLATKPNLLERARTVLGSEFLATDVNALNLATADFKNFGQFVAALNVSNNLGIPFSDLKLAMTGTALDGTTLALNGTEWTGGRLSLGQAIQELQPGVNATAEAQAATAQASVDINSTTGTTSTTSTTTTTTKKNSKKVVTSASR
jgi:hypothetical protein